MSETRRPLATEILDSLYDLALNRFLDETDFDPRDYFDDAELAQWETAQQEELETSTDVPRSLARRVIIEVLGGVAEVTSKPEDVEVEIIDHDNEGA
jgi:hypothetical protein